MSLHVPPMATRRPGDAPLCVLEILSNAIVGGMETAVLRLVSRLPRSAYRVLALCPFHSAVTAALAEVVEAVHVAPMGEQLRWHTIQHAAVVVRQAQVDVIHAHLWTAHRLAALVGRLTRTPVLATAHGMHVTMQDLEAHLLGDTHLCLVSEAARAHAVAVGARPQRVHVVRNGVDTAQFTPQRRNDATADVVIGYVGRLSPEKNPQLFVRAAARVARQCPRARFVVVGDGPLRAELEGVARDLGLGDAIRFEGIRDDMPGVYARLDVLALTSWHEGTPLVLLEAMASGIPVVATSVGGVPELIEADVTGLLSRPGDDVALATALLDLARDPARRARLGAGARARACTHFALAPQVDATAALLRAVASERAGAARTHGAIRAVRSVRPDG